jgi:hypothetical protein
MNNDTEQPRFSTMHELRFIENIGLNQFGSMIIQNRKTLLRNYINAAEKRADWANIDKDMVLSTAKKLLKEAAK